MPSQVRALALGCAADLMKAEEAQRAAADSPDFLPTVLDALQARPTLPYPTPTPPAPLCLAKLYLLPFIYFVTIFCCTPIRSFLAMLTSFKHFVVLN